MASLSEVSTHKRTLVRAPARPSATEGGHCGGSLVAHVVVEVCGGGLSTHLFVCFPEARSQLKADDGLVCAPCDDAEIGCYYQSYALDYAETLRSVGGSANPKHCPPDG